MVTKRKPYLASVAAEERRDGAMGFPAEITDDDLARARQDPSFRHQLVHDHLERLLSALNQLRSAADNPAGGEQIREGVAMAVRLADILHRIGDPGGSGA